MTMTVTSPKVLHVEVSAEAPQDLRARLRMSPLTAEAATLLPGGVIRYVIVDIDYRVAG